MSNKKFEEFLNQQTENADSKPIDWDKKRANWIRDLGAFYGSIESFLKPYIEEGKIKMAYGKKKIFEEHLGEYEAKNAMIFLGSNKVKLEPIGTNLIGVEGRVDLIGPNGKVKFFLINKATKAQKISVCEQPPLAEENGFEEECTWKIATSPPNLIYFDLEQNSFFDALMEVANG
jgi:hypothetical protein